MLTLGRGMRKMRAGKPISRDDSEVEEEEEEEEEEMEEAEREVGILKRG